MKAAVMQPYFFPYLGYFQLIAAVDLFVVYDNIQYVKSGWINRNRICRNGAPALLSLPLKGASDFLDVREREVAAGFKPEKLLNQVQGAYRPAPEFERVYPLIEQVLCSGESNLFQFVHRSIRAICDFLSIGTEMRISSDIAIDHALKKHDKVLALCRAVGADTYVNPIGGTELYSKEDFARHAVELKFIRMKPLEYAQCGAPFVPMLSIIDVLMFNPAERVREWIADHYDFV